MNLPPIIVATCMQCFIILVDPYIHAFLSKRTGLSKFYPLHVFSSNAHKVFDKSPERHATLMHDKGYGALESFVQENVLGKKPTKYQLCAALNCCAKTHNSRLGSQIHAKIVHTGFDQNLYINSSLVSVYAKCGSIGDAMKVFNGLELHDEVSWTSMICGLSQNRQ
ncbi:hypothetical protein E3N88_12131 [Mikania micrantha]|uniref:Pentatricopeptide repeat-containing protein n=1 Tax=Mikania micrantha TaxID=192012 RepID=A0A5N6P4Y7_9ASTR|nr:hypothetical protein E3N88_12131 [Mikania micrantha]